MSDPATLADELVELYRTAGIEGVTAWVCRYPGDEPGEHRFLPMWQYELLEAAAVKLMCEGLGAL